jgi:hypothetical protein
VRAAEQWLKAQFGGEGRVYVLPTEIHVDLTNVDCQIGYEQLAAVAEHFGTKDILLEHEAAWDEGCSCGSDGELKIVIRGYTRGAP